MCFIGVVATLVALVLPMIILYKSWSTRKDSNSNNIDQQDASSSVAISHVVLDLEDSRTNDDDVIREPVESSSSSMLDYKESNDNIHNAITQQPPPRTTSPATSHSVDSSYSSSLPSVEYEVFLSFSGPDTRSQITDILFHFLTRSKIIHTFKDDDRLRQGEEKWPRLVKVISQSKVYVPIFSENYAHSKWRLNELAEIVKCWKQDKRRIVLPIFYMVDPRDVGYQSGPYEQAFKKHEKIFDPSTIETWRNALREIGTLKGWHVKNKNEQVAVSDDVSEVIWSHLSKSNVSLDDSVDLVGINDHVNAVVDSLSLDSDEDTVMVGIHGIGGIGKTTLATAVYNKISARFDRCIFLENIRETQQDKDGIITLQKKLISHILRNYSVAINDAHQGRKIIRERASKFKVLVVLDDVDDAFKFDNVSGNIGNFLPGSRFIATSRDIRVLRRLNIEKCRLYEVKYMDPGRSLQLFCKHAFRKDSPPQEFDALSRDFVSTIGGLPLTLKVVGSLLYLEKVNVWKEKLAQLKDTTKQEVIEGLMISYNALEYAAKQIFLDIACFFIGSDKQIVSYMWDDCNFRPIINIKILIQGSMIMIDDDDKFQMHGQLRDLGREIVRRESEKHPWLRSRIWSNDEAADLLLSNQLDTEQVKAIKVNSPSSDVWELGSERFTNLSELRFFHAKGREMIVDFNHLLPNLKWLELEATRINNLNMKNLIILAVDGLEHDLGIKEARKLKVLNLIYRSSELSKLPEFPKSESLEILHIEYFENRNENLEIAKLSNLKRLDLQHCKLGKILGGTIGMMRRLGELNVSFDFECDYDSFRQAIVDIGVLPSLKVLNVNSPHLVDVLQGIKLPKSLKFLHTASGFDNLEELSDLEEISVDESRMRLAIPPTIITCEKLKSMRLYSVEGVTMAESLPSSLTRLHIRCLKSDKFPNLMDLQNLTELVLKECHNIQEIHGLGWLKSLQILVIDAAGKLTRINGLGDLMSSSQCRLKLLRISECPLLRTLQHSEENSAQIESLLIMRIQGGRFLDGKSIPKLSKFPRLKELEIGGINLNIDGEESATQQHQVLEGLENLEELVHLKVHHLPKVQRLPSLSKLRKLKKLVLEDVPGVREIVGLGDLKSLETLQISRCFALERLRFGDLPYYNMESIDLDLRGCTNFTYVDNDLSPLTAKGVDQGKLIRKTLHLPHEPLPWWMGHMNS